MFRILKAAWTPFIMIWLLLLFPNGEGWAQSRVQGIEGVQGADGPEFRLRAQADSISIPDGASLHFWGYADVNGDTRVQYPGPTLIVTQGDKVTIRLSNELPQNVSMVFPGLEGVTASGGVEGILTREISGDGVSEVTYSFVASQPGTYHYYSGTHPELQIEMGLVGALIVRPVGFDSGNTWAYNDLGSRFDHEILFLLTEMDPRVHDLVEQGRFDDVRTNEFSPVYWFINGRAAPDTMHSANAPWLPTQPYNCMPRLHPGERLLMRVINAGRDAHPFHHHGNHSQIIARDARLLESVQGVTGPDMSVDVFTIGITPGSTVDSIFTWTGAGLGWDVYGHQPGDDMAPNEAPADHAKLFNGKSLPVDLPEDQELTYGGAYSGSPFLGSLGALPVGEGGLNLNGGLFYMWHSHTEKEMVNFDVFPGGMMTMAIVEPAGIAIP